MSIIGVSARARAPYGARTMSDTSGAAAVVPGLVAPSSFIVNGIDLGQYDDAIHKIARGLLRKWGTRYEYGDLYSMAWLEAYRIAGVYDTSRGATYLGCLLGWAGQKINEALESRRVMRTLSSCGAEREGDLDLTQLVSVPFDRDGWSDLRETMGLLFPMLTWRERYLSIEYFVKGRKIQSISRELGISHQRMYRIIEKIRAVFRASPLAQLAGAS